MIKNRWGISTAGTCYFCNKVAGITKNSQGLTTCKECKDKIAEVPCPACGDILDPRSGKFGDFFFCWGCNKNWSKSKITRWNN
jgi:uncharacterized protein with PIN domain